MSFKFIAIAYGMLGATAATGYIAQGGGGSGAPGNRVADPPKVERVAKLEMPLKPNVMPQIAMVALPQQDPVPAPVAAPAPVMAAAPVAAPVVVPSAMPLTAPPTPPPPPVEPPSHTAARAEKPTVVRAEKPVDQGFSRGYVQITADMTVNPWTGAWLTSDDRSMGYVSGPAAVTAPASLPVMVAEQPPAAEMPVTVAMAAPPPPEPVPSPPVMAPVAKPVSDKTAPPPVVRQEAARQETGHRHGYMAHLASYRDETHAAAGWKTLQKAHRDLLVNRSPVTVTAEVPGQGTFVRLMTDGFSQLADVSEFCSEIKTTGQYCIPVKGK